MGTNKARKKSRSRRGKVSRAARVAATNRNSFSLMTRPRDDDQDGESVEGKTFFIYDSRRVQHERTRKNRVLSGCWWGPIMTKESSRGREIPQEASD
jgi:hypothetical protein